MELASIEHHQLVIPAIARGLGLLEAVGLSAFEQIRTRLGASRVLLLLDNFEHLLSAADAIADLLADCSGVQVLATSRIPLGIRAEHELPVPPLDSSMAVELFAERATAVQPAFALTDENTQHVAEICRQLDGLPLAIELAAARVRALTLNELCVMLSRHRLAALSGGARDLPERHHTLRATIAWSYELLDSSEQRLFRRLAVFRGGFGIAAATALHEAESNTLDVIDGLQSLVSKNMLVRAPDHADEARFTMLETIREFALEQLDSSCEKLLAEKDFARVCRALAESAEQELMGSRSAMWLARLDGEVENFRAVVGLAAASRQHDLVAEGLRLVGALWWFCRQRGRLREAREWSECLLPLYAQHDGVRGWALITAFFGWQLVARPTALERAGEALDIGHAIGDERLVGLSLVGARAGQPGE